MSVPVPEHVRPLRRAEFDKLVALGAFQDERIELVYGVLVPMSPIGPRHSSAIDRLTLLFVRAVGDRAWVRVQNPFAAGDISEPQPDILVAPLASYEAEHPEIAHLVIEVAESSLAYDRGTKLRLYAEQGVPEYWIVDVVARRIEVHRDPVAGSFRNVQIFERGEGITPLLFPDVTIQVAQIMG